MDRKLDAGALLVGAASLLLAVSLFLDWYGVDGSTSVTAWRAFEVWDLVLLAAAGVAVAATFGPLDTRALVIAAGVAFVVVVSQLIQAPPAAQGADLRTGAWLALIAVFGLVGGAALSAAKIAVTVDVQGRERRRRVPAVDRRGEQVEDRVAPSRDEAPGDDVTTLDRFAPEAEDTQATQSFEATDDPRP
jgi:hypothetical protein